ncbi:MAG: reductase [Aerococcus sp.]|nr:reductase [Aerococcus sp.]
MLIPYKANHDKIAMGLVSYIDKFKDLKALTQEMDRIKTGKRKAYLWRDEETDNIVGLIAFDISADDEVLIIRYLTINPSFRGESLSYAMLSALADEFPECSISGGLALSDLLNKWAVHEQRTQPNIVTPPAGDETNES